MLLTSETSRNSIQRKTCLLTSETSIIIGLSGHFNWPFEGLAKMVFLKLLVVIRIQKKKAVQATKQSSYATFFSNRAGPVVSCCCCLIGICN